MDEVRRRVQQDTLGRRGHRNDPLYRIRRLLTTARENLTDRGRAWLEAALQVGDPSLEVTSPGTPTRTCVRCSTPRHWPLAEPSRNGCSTVSIAAQFRRSPALGERCDRGARRFWRTSTPAGSATAAPKQSTSSLRRPAAWPTGSTGSATSPNTASASCSPPTAPDPGDVDDANQADLPTRRSEEPVSVEGQSAGRGVCGGSRCVA